MIEVFLNKRLLISDVHVYYVFLTMVMTIQEDAIFSQELPQFLVPAHVLTHTVGHIEQCPRGRPIRKRRLNTAMSCAFHTNFHYSWQLILNKASFYRQLILNKVSFYRQLILNKVSFYRQLILNKVSFYRQLILNKVSFYRLIINVVKT